jgi:glycosyltransferase involved in cell wall biosynthesis
MDPLHPTFSIVVPIYNEEKYIREAIDSILSQTETDWEAILVDDGSTDSTPGILDEYAKKDKRVRVFHKPNGGQSTAINKGVSEARGDWLCWLSGDDYFHPQKLELNRQWIQKYSDVDFFFSGHWLILSNGEKIEYNLDWLSLEFSDYHLISLFRCNFVMGISICIRRETWLRTGEFDENLRYAHDLDMWLRLILIARTKYLPDRTCTMRYHPGQETARFPLAPLFDSAKSLIFLLNKHSFTEFFPGIDLIDRHKAVDILIRSLDFVASEPNSNFYALGYHPLLLLRTLEWIFDQNLDPSLRTELRKIFLKRASEMNILHAKSPFGLMWKAIRSTLMLQDPHFGYEACLPSQIGTVYYYQQKREGSEKSEPLKTYLERFEGLTSKETAENYSSITDLVILLPCEHDLDEIEQVTNKFIQEILPELIIYGFSLLIIQKSRSSLGMINGVTYIGSENKEEMKELVRNLENVQTLVAINVPDGLDWINANRKINFNLIENKRSPSETVASLILQIESTSLKEEIVLPSKAHNFVWLHQKIRRKLRYWRNRLSLFLSKKQA